MGGATALREGATAAISKQNNSKAISYTMEQTPNTCVGKIPPKHPTLNASLRVGFPSLAFSGRSFPFECASHPI